MPLEQAVKLRRALRNAVRSQWNTDEGFIVQENLKSIARASIMKDYEYCATQVPAREFRKCLREKADAAKLAYKYRELWGTAPGT